jgi:hypothetical protein
MPILKLTAKNERHFFKKNRHSTVADHVWPGEMFVAAKRYEYAQLQEMAMLAGVAMRRATPADMVELKEKHASKYPNVKHLYWEKDARRLFICITKEERIATLAKHQTRWKKHQEERAIESGVEWFDSVLSTLDHFRQQIETSKERFKEAAAGESQYMGPSDYIDSAVGDLQSMVGNLHFRNVTRVIKDLVQAGVHNRMKKGD